MSRVYEPRVANKLPVYWGCTVDLRCKQFIYERKDGTLEFLRFGEDQGDNLLTRMIHHGLLTDQELSNLF